MMLPFIDDDNGVGREDRDMLNLNYLKNIQEWSSKHIDMSKRCREKRWPKMIPEKHQY